MSNYLNQIEALHDEDKYMDEQTLILTYRELFNRNNDQFVLDRAAELEGLGYKFSLGYRNKKKGDEVIREYDLYVSHLYKKRTSLLLAKSVQGEYLDQFLNYVKAPVFEIKEERNW